MLSTFFLTTQCTCVDLWGRNGISQDISRIDFKDCSRETWNCCKPFPWRIARKIVLSSLLSSVLKCNLFKCRMLISTEPCNHINLYTRTYPVVFDNISSNNNWELERKNHQLSGSLIDLVMQKKKPTQVGKPHTILKNSNQFTGWEKSDCSIKFYQSFFQARGCKALMLFPVWEKCKYSLFIEEKPL